jgi:short-subunit dehydrogenase involved in D-alanine esterification of teichoic acids
MPAKAPRTILITGSTRGCGRAMTERFIEAGHASILLGRRCQSLPLTGSMEPCGSPVHFENRFK